MTPARRSGTSQARWYHRIHPGRSLTVARV
jgi:hypothetical protein